MIDKDAVPSSAKLPSLMPALAVKRLRPTTQGSRTPLEEALSDRARITTSTAFRRLQTKAQVFSLEKNATVRSRLTHTLEVATYGLLMAERIGKLLVEKGHLEADHLFLFLVTVENACLLHDVGNPPFGHLGEFAIRKWFEGHEKRLTRLWRSSGIDKKTIDRYRAAYCAFDGNAQGFRIITRLQWLHDEYGLNLTTGLLGACIKYPADETSDEPFHHKVGFFPSEREVAESIWRDNGQLGNTRHPISFICEAADDIAYSVSDIEDAIEKKVVGEDDFFAHIAHHKLVEYDGAYQKRTSGSPKPEHARLARFISYRIEMTRFLVKQGSDLFVDNYEDLRTGNFKTPLLKVDPASKKAIEALDDFTRANIFLSSEAINIELSGHRIVHDILEGMEPILDLHEGDFNCFLRAGKPDSDHKKLRAEAPLESRLIALLPRRYANLYRWSVSNNPRHERLYRTQLLIDYVAGMTDTHALQVHDMLMGNVRGLEP